MSLKNLFRAAALAALLSPAIPVATASAVGLVMPGLHYREIGFGTPDFKRNEAAAFAAWLDANIGHDVLESLMFVVCIEGDVGCVEECGVVGKRPLGHARRRDRRIVSTILQWLGTGEGEAFLANYFSRID